ncbi:MAG: pre-peptidase C-terminal domain-containing protein [Pirellulales bacterium]
MAYCFAQSTAPSYAECRLDSIFPNGGMRGTTVKVQFKGVGSGLLHPQEIIIDGPGGIAVKELQSIDGSTLEATLDIAADATLGRRWLRVLNERSGLTNFAHFVVGALPEVVEAEPNDDPARAQTLDLTPTVVCGRINPQADLDVFKFHGKAGQKVVAAIAAHALDIHGQGRNYGIADFSLELLDSTGKTLAAAEDTLGFDPLIEYALPADGDYFVRVLLLNYGGFPEAVYRLTLGETPYVVGAFPPGLQRGADREIELFGPNVPQGTKRRVAVAPIGAPQADPAFLLRHLTLQDTPHGGLDVPLVLGHLPEIVEAEPNDGRPQAPLLAWPTVVNARFDQPGDADWYRLELAAEQKVWLKIVAQRYVRSPVDTLIQVYDAAGALLLENDDESFEPGYECFHDFKTTDSKLMLTAPATGEYFVKVTEQSGGGGPRAIYRLTVEEARPDFRLTHFPDAVPIWGPGSTAAVLVRVDRYANFDEDVEISVEGLPAGWNGSTATSLGNKGLRPYTTYQHKLFLTITAPADARPGTCVPFQIVGRASVESPPQTGEGRQQPGAPSTDPPPGSGSNLASEAADDSVHPSIPLTLYYTSDTGFFRASPQSRAAVARPQGPWLDTAVREITLSPGGSGTIAVKVLGGAEGQPTPTTMPLVANLATAGVACALTTPQVLPINNGMVEVPIKVPAEIHQGTYYFTIAQTWGSDIRGGMPAPCTPLMKLKIVPAR